MTQEHNQEKPRVEKIYTQPQQPQGYYNPSGGGYGGGYGGGGMPPRGGNSGGGMNWLGIVAIILTIIGLIGMYMWTNGQMQTLQGLPNQVSQFTTDANAKLNGISGNITAAVNAAVGSYETRIHALETQIAGYATSGQLGQSNTNIANLTSQITALQATINSANLTGMQTQITALQVLLNQIIDANDLLHTAITISGVGEPEAWTSNTTEGLGNSYTYFTISIKNNKDYAVTIKDLTIDLTHNYYYDGDGYFTPISIQLFWDTGKDTKGKSPTINTFTSYTAHDIGLAIAANSTKTFALYFRVNWSSGTNDETTLLADMSISPEVTLVSYTTE